MGKAQGIRLAVALTVIGVGVPLTVIANSRSSEAGTTPTGAVTQVGSQVGAVTGAGSSAAGASRAATGTVSGAAKVAGTTSGTPTPTPSSCSSTGNSNLPADKMTVGASTAQVFGPGDNVTLLCARMKTSTTADLTFSVTLECSILTSVTTTGNDTQTAMGDIKVWVEVDGHNVGVLPAQPGQSDDGKVTFCNRTFTATTSNFTADSSATIQDYENTKDANAFNWVALSVGNQVHTISVHCTLTQTTTNSTKDMAKAVVGARTVTVDATHNAQNATQ